MRFDQELRALVSGHLAAHDRYALDGPGLRPAAVAVTLVDSGAGAAFLLTRRTPRLTSHAGQWALPGGRVDPGETVVDAALRELDEELALRDVDVLGLLDDYATRSGYLITPVVLWAGADVTPIRNPAEVAEVHRVPLAELEGDDVPRWASVPGVDGPVIQIPIVGTLVHAPTGAIIHQLREVALHGRPTRVAHLPEPPFARR